MLDVIFTSSFDTKDSSKLILKHTFDRGIEFFLRDMK